MLSSCWANRLLPTSLLCQLLTTLFGLIATLSKSWVVGTFQGISLRMGIWETCVEGLGVTMYVSTTGADGFLHLMGLSSAGCAQPFRNSTHVAGALLLTGIASSVLALVGWGFLLRHLSARSSSASAAVAAASVRARLLWGRFLVLLSFLVVVAFLAGFIALHVAWKKDLCGPGPVHDGISTHWGYSHGMAIAAFALALVSFGTLTVQQCKLQQQQYYHRGEGLPTSTSATTGYTQDLRTPGGDPIQ